MYLKGKEKNEQEWKQSVFHAHSGKGPEVISWLQQWQIRLEIKKKKFFEDEWSSNGRLQNLEWVLEKSRIYFSLDNIKVANHTLGKKGCTKWLLKFPFSSPVLLMWLPTLMYFGLNPIPNCFWVDALDLFSNKSTSESGPQFNQNLFWNPP